MRSLRSLVIFSTLTLVVANCKSSSNTKPLAGAGNLPKCSQKMISAHENVWKNLNKVSDEFSLIGNSGYSYSATNNSQLKLKDLKNEIANLKSTHINDFEKEALKYKDGSCLIKDKKFNPKDSLAKIMETYNELRKKTL